MTITLKPEVEALIQKRLASGAFENAADVLWQALESQDAEAAWLLPHRREVSGKIDGAIAQTDRAKAFPQNSPAPGWRRKRRLGGVSCARSDQHR